MFKLPLTLEGLRFELRCNERRQKSWRRKIEGARTERSRQSYVERLQACARSGARIAEKIEQIEQQQRSEEVRHVDDPFPAMTPPHAGWTLRANRALRFGSVDVRRGAEVTAAMLASAANAPALLGGGHVRWMPPQVAKAPRPAPSPVVAKPVVTRDPLDEFLDKLERIAVKRRCDPADTFDLIDGDLRGRAIKAYADMPKVINSGAFGSGGGTPTASGVGTYRRLVDGFEQYCLMRLAQRKKDAA